MHANRLRLAQPYRFNLPQAPEQAVAAGSFVLCPLPCLGAARTQQLYRQAFEQARAVVRPSLPERDLLGVWN